MHDFQTWWQHLPQNISPVIFEIGWFKLQYYGLMYIVAFGITFLLVLYRLKHEKQFGFTTDQIKDIMEGRDPRPPAGWDDRSDSDSSGGASAEEGEDAGGDAPIGGPAGQH